MKTSFPWATLMVPFLMLGCASSGPYKESLKHAFNNLGHVEAGRTIASDPSGQMTKLGVDFEQLGNDIEVMVFPKVNNLAHKSPDLEAKARKEQLIREHGKIKGLWKWAAEQVTKKDYLAPVTFRIRAEALGLCSELKNNYTAFDHPQKSKYLGEKCAVLEVEQIFPNVLQRNIKNDDIVRMKIYIDDQFRPYGQEVEIAQIDKEYNISLGNKEIGLSPIEHLTSGLSYFPIDLPNFDQANSMFTGGAEAVKEDALEIPLNSYVENKVKNLTQIKYCEEGHRIEYTDIYDNEVRMGWCSGHPWPTSVDTNRFFSIIKSL